MTYDREKSDSGEVATKPINKIIETVVAELVERRTETKGKTVESTTCRTQSRASVSPGLERLRQRAIEHRNERFTSLLHHITVDLLSKAYHWLKHDAAVGVDGVTWDAYGADLQANLVDLHGRVHRGAYRAQPSRRRMIPKPGGGERPLGIASLEDKIVQRALVEVLNAIYEPEFLGFSYGFRPGRSQHDALDALWVGISTKRVNWILDADLRSYFDTIDHEKMVGFLEERIGDRRVIRLIRKWLKAGVMEDGLLKATEIGSPQGSVISPLLSNVYLHYVFDTWAHQWRNAPGRGCVILVRYADDFICGFEREADAQAFMADLATRMEANELSLHPDKTRLIEFGRYAAENRGKRGLEKPETFTFLGFTHLCGRNRSGKFLLFRKSRRDRMRNKLRTVKEQLRRRINASIPEQGRWLGQVVRGYFAYHAVPGNSHALNAFRHYITAAWLRCLRRRSQRRGMTWAKIARLAEKWLPMPRALHPWPNVRFAVTHPR
jgi:group II intron reverse transcriptase/maturase